MLEHSVQVNPDVDNTFTTSAPYDQVRHSFKDAPPSVRNESLAERQRRTPAARSGTTHHSGFTLIELMIVVAVIAILTSIAYPSYITQLRTGHRATAQSYMMALAEREGRYLIDARAYAPTAAALGFSATPADVSPYYTITIAVPAATSPPTFTITATPIGSQVPDGNLTLDNQGTKTPSAKW